MEADLLDIELLCARNGYRMPTELVVAVDVNAAPPVASVVERARARDAHPTGIFPSVRRQVARDTQDPSGARVPRATPPRRRRLSNRTGTSPPR